MTQNPRKPAKANEIEQYSEFFGVRKGLEMTLDVLRDRRSIGPEHEVLISICRGLADQVNDAPNNPIIWREYRAAVRDLHEKVGNNADPFDELLAGILAEVGDQKEQTK